MDDREIIKLYNCRSEDALLETEKKYGKLVSFIIGRLIKNQLDVEECTNDTYLGVWFTIPPKTPDNLKAYILKIARNQALVIGYIKDGVMYDGESFGSLSGSYELKVREGGEYNLYIISATSDYLTLKQGTINLSK